MYPDIQLAESITIPTYLIYLSALYCFLIFFTYHRAKKLNYPVKTTLDLAFIMMVMGFIGGRLLHVFFEAPFYYKEDWVRILYFWQGGFVFYGGFLTAFICCLAYLHWIPKQKSQNRTWLQWSDFYAPVIALGYGLGRFSCFLAGCCYGRACDLPWSVVFPWDYHGTPRHPVQLYMVIWELAAFAMLIVLEKKKRPSGNIFFVWLFFHGLGRLIFEQFRDDFRGDFILSLSLSSWVSLGLISVASLALVLQAKKKT